MEISVILWNFLEFSVLRGRKEVRMGWSESSRHALSSEVERKWGGDTVITHDTLCPLVFSEIFWNSLEFSGIFCPHRKEVVRGDGATTERVSASEAAFWGLQILVTHDNIRWTEFISQDRLIISLLIYWIFKVADVGVLRESCLACHSRNWWCETIELFNHFIIYIIHFPVCDHWSLEPPLESQWCPIMSLSDYVITQISDLFEEQCSLAPFCWC